MTSEPPFDPRGVANLLLDRADERSIRLTNLALQKLMYFAHACFLIEKREPLLFGYFEAWQLGPVHPTIYRSFKSAGSQPIGFRAVSENLRTGAKSVVPPPKSTAVEALITRIVEAYGRMTAGRLVDIAHARNAPWDFIVNKGKTGLAFGLRIPDNVIKQRFKFHKVTVTDFPTHGEPSENTPFA